MNNNKSHSSASVCNNIKQTIEHLFYKMLPVTVMIYMYSFFLCDKSYEILGRTVILSEGFKYACYFMNFCDSFNLGLSYLLVAEVIAMIVLVRLSKMSQSR